MVIPEMGFDDDPTSPVSRLETVTNRKPNKENHDRADEPLQRSIQDRAAE